MKKQIAFIDESGNNGLDFTKAEVSTHFIVTAILFDENNINIEDEKINAIRKKHFQTGEMKSSNVGSNDSRRLEILKDLNDINYHIFSYVIDKRELTTEGFKYKASFYKFLHSLVDKELYRVFPKIQIVADEHGRDDFKTSFIKYIKEKYITDLFNQDFRITNSKAEYAVQLADFITGTVARCYESKKISGRKQELLEAIKNKITEIRFWPNSNKEISFTKDVRSDFDIEISELSLSLAQQFIDKYQKSNIPSEIDQVTCLQYLVFYFKHIDADRYISTYELMGNINAIKTNDISIHYFRSKVIAKLRDKGILISSSSQGYKLPSSTKDLLDFVHHSNSYIQPMIERIMTCRNLIKLATKNQIDILEQEQYKYLFQLKNNN